MPFSVLKKSAHAGFSKFECFHINFTPPVDLEFSKSQSASIEIIPLYLQLRIFYVLVIYQMLTGATLGKNLFSGYCSSHGLLTTTKPEDKRNLKVTHFTSYSTELVNGQELSAAALLCLTNYKSNLIIAPHAPRKGRMLPRSYSHVGMPFGGKGSCHLFGWQLRSLPLCRWSETWFLLSKCIL